MAKGCISSVEVQQYHAKGFLLAKAFYDREEIDLLKRAAKEDREMDSHAYSRNDGEGGNVRLSVWNHPGDTIYGMFARCESIVESATRLLNDEIYHYHSKMIMKDAKVGGAWTWHQDYGYWYQNGVLFPALTSVSIAVDAATKENGCMQVIPYSHTLGRIEHILKGEQAGADMERVAEVLKRLPLVYVEAEPGDALFFHPNLLHRSDQNTSDNPRWSMICCYNSKKNDPYKESHHPRYTPLNKVPDSAIKQAGLKRFSTGDSAWMNEHTDRSATVLSGKD
ncbi:MAG TPA: phytanoyl-CoA dioxygenase family protein [Terriglobales bacterium]|jgi:ectoine hydroxylase-related dioxygenase (phytanoyl-CoA dioxygenase family)|nr:phytanoyl-CoA dioxygenase family protein [Terriglobales bacterium]